MEEREKIYCPVTNKICLSQKDANTIINKAKYLRKSKQSKVIPQRSYLCKHCGTYHLTHFRNYKTCKSTLRKNGMRDSSRFN